MNKKVALIFVGKSGCGKGTQTELLQQYFENNNICNPLYIFTTSDNLRAILDGSTFLKDKCKVVMSSGGLLPNTFTISAFARGMLENMTEDTSLIVDGYARSVPQAESLVAICQFLDFTELLVVDLDTTDDEVINRMKLRGRSDDTDAGIAARMAFYQNDVMPAIEYFKNNSFCKYYKIDGNNTIPKVHEDIINSVSFGE